MTESGAGESVLRLRGLRAAAGQHVVLEDVDLDVAPGAVLAVVGRSGSGKTTLAHALQGESRPGVALTGAVWLHGRDLLGATEAQRRRLRAGTTAMLPQHPGAVLNPMRRIGPALRDVAALRAGGNGPGTHTPDEAVRGALAAAQLDAQPGLLRRFPHQLSGGQQQRVALAQALVVDPDVVVLDEPTTGADTVTTSDIATTLAGLVAGGTALVLLTHDLPLVRRLADATVVLDSGRIVERGRGTRPLRAPVHEETRTVVAAEPALPDTDGRTADRDSADGDGADGDSADTRPVLRAERLCREAGDGTRLLSDVDLDVHSGRCAAIVGRSGAGKTTLARCLAGLTRPNAGRVQLGDVTLASTARRRTREQLRHVQYVHQDPRSGFDPRRPVVHQLARTAERLRGVPRGRARTDAEDMLAEFGVDPPRARCRPEQLSGGQLQRAALVRALLARPAVLICDESTSALDVVTQGELMRVLATVRSTMDTALVLISHDIAAASALAEEVHVLHAGRIVESTTPARLLTSPQTPPARALAEAAREHHRGDGDRAALSAE